MYTNGRWMAIALKIYQGMSTESILYSFRRMKHFSKSWVALVISVLLWDSKINFDRDRSRRYGWSTWLSCVWCLWFPKLSLDCRHTMTVHGCCIVSLRRRTSSSNITWNCLVFTVAASVSATPDPILSISFFQQSRIEFQEKFCRSLEDSAGNLTDLATENMQFDWFCAVTLSTVTLLSARNHWRSKVYACTYVQLLLAAELKKLQRTAKTVPVSEIVPYARRCYQALHQCKQYIISSSSCSAPLRYISQPYQTTLESASYTAIAAQRMHAFYQSINRKYLTCSQKMVGTGISSSVSLDKKTKKVNVTGKRNKMNNKKGAIYALHLKFLTQTNLVVEFHRKNVSFTCKQRISVSEPPFWGS